jgi:hypothetical protein
MGQTGPSCCQQGLAAFHSWKHVLKKPDLNIATKLQIIGTVIKPCITYGMEVWAPSKRLTEVIKMLATGEADSIGEDSAWSNGPMLCHLPLFSHIGILLILAHIGPILSMPLKTTQALIAGSN